MPASSPYATTPQELDRLAHRRARAKLGWYIHGAAFLVVNAVLVSLSLGHPRFWAIYPLLGWGLGLALHGIAVWTLLPGSRWMAALVDRERAHLSEAPRA